MSRAICPLCSQPIGYERQYTTNTNGDIYHMACAIDEALKRENKP